MYNLEIKKNNPALFRKTEPFDFNTQNSEISDIVEYSLELCQLMWKEKALGLAANQVGQSASIFAMIGEPESFVCVNPRVVHTYTEVVELEETSLSHPGLVFEKSRPKSIRMRFQGPNGEAFARVFTGFTARIVQQMIDHLDGVPIWNSISRIKFDMAVRKARKLGFDYSALSYKAASKSSIILPETTKPGTFYFT